MTVFISALYQALCRQLPSAKPRAVIRRSGLITGQYGLFIQR